MQNKEVVIACVVDNAVATPHMLAEWGLSIYLQVDGTKILFDTGAGNQGLLLHNLDVLGIKVSELDYLILSHGHQDHTGGIRPLLQRLQQESPGKTLEIVGHPSVLATKYSKNEGSSGCPHTKEELLKLGARFNFHKTPTWLTDNIVVSGEIPLTNQQEGAGHNFYQEIHPSQAESIAIINPDELGFPTFGKSFIQDDLKEEQALFLKTSKGLIVVLGCAHRGLVNTVKHAKLVTGTEKVRLVIGGTHLAEASDQHLQWTIEKIRELKIQRLGVSHCTGLEKISTLRQHLGEDNVFFNNAGSLTRLVL